MKDIVQIMASISNANVNTLDLKFTAPRLLQSKWVGRNDKILITKSV